MLNIFFMNHFGQFVLLLMYEYSIVCFVCVGGVTLHKDNHQLVQNIFLRINKLADEYQNIVH